MSERNTSSMKSILAAAMIAGISALSYAQPASAGGSLSLNFRPSNTDEAIALHTALQIYSIVKDVKSSGSIRQKGRNNSAGMRQNGYGNRGVIYQEGRGHQGSLAQNGNNNSYGLFQFGKNTNARIVQNGYGQSGAAILFGW